MADSVKSQVAPKRTQYKPGGLTDFPEHIMNRAQFGYRWISQSKLAEASDGYEPRGWEIFKEKDTGKVVKRGDLILAQMPIDMYKDFLTAEKTAREDQVRLVLEGLHADEERLTDEFRRKGGKVKFEFKQETE